MFGIQVFILTFVVFVTFVAGLLRPAEVRYQWKYLNYTWSSAKQYHDAVANGDYMPKNNMPASIKMWKGQLYTSVPRLRQGVPATVVVTPLEPVNGNRSPNLQPYPNWQMQKIGDCNALQSVQGVEIDPKGRMWVVDCGRVNFLEDNKPLCPPRLMILDLNNNGKILLDYHFPNNVVDPDTSFLSSIALDNSDGGYAYITNVDSQNPSIVVFSLEQRSSWSISHKSMHPTVEIVKVKNDNDVITVPFGINAIALSSVSTEGERMVYYCPVSSYDLFSIPADVLKNNPQGFANQVKLIGKKPSPTDNMIMSANDELYFGLISDNQVAKWNTKEMPFSKYQQRVYEDNVALIWPDAFAIDETKKLWVTSNRFHKVANNHVDISQVNLRISLLGQLDCKSYQYYKNGTIPEVPEIKPVANHSHSGQIIPNSDECI